jgi:hypothetical protein
MLRIRRPFWLKKPLNRLSIQPVRRLRKLLTKEGLLEAAHVMGPTLTALLFAGASSALAHAQGTISFSGAQTLMQKIQTFAEYAGAVICLVGLIFAGINFMSGNIQRGVIGLFGAIFGAAVLGWGAGWISSRFAYVAVSRASHDAQIFTNDAAGLAESLSRNVSKACAIDFSKNQSPVATMELKQAAIVKTPTNGIGLAL